MLLCACPTCLPLRPRKRPKGARDPGRRPCRILKLLVRGMRRAPNSVVVPRVTSLVPCPLPAPPAPTLTSAFKEAVRERNKNRPSKKRKQNVFDQPLVIPRNPKQSQQGGLQGSELQPDEQGDLQGLDGEGEVELEGEAGGELEGGGDGDGDGDGELLLPGDGLSDGGDMPGMGMMMGDMGMGMGLINGQG